MKILLTVFAVLGALTTAAIADDAATTPPPADPATPPATVDCTGLEGEA